MADRLTEAIEFVRSTLLSVLPRGVPASFDTILSAKYAGTGNRQRVIGQLRMFDGKPAVVECWQAGPCRAHTFTSLPGGSISWEGERWIRVDDIDTVQTSDLPLFCTPAGRRALEQEGGDRE